MRSVEDYKNLLLVDVHRKNMETLDRYDGTLTEFQSNRPDELSKYKAHITRVANFKKVVQELKFDYSSDNVFAAVLKEIEDLQDDWLTESENKSKAIFEDIERLKHQIEEENKLHNVNLIQQNESDNVSYNTLEAKRAVLEKYSDKIFDLCNQYGITTSDLSVDESMFTPDELDRLYDDYIRFMQKEAKGSNPISRFRNTVKDSMFQGAIILIILILSFTAVLDFVAIGFFALLVANQIASVNRAKYYSVLAAIVFNIQPINMGYTALDNSMLLPEELTDELIEADPRFSIFEQRLLELEEELSDMNPEELQQKAVLEWNGKKSEIASLASEYSKIFTDKVERIISDIDSEIAYLEEEYKKAQDAFKPFGFRASKHPYMTNSFIMGVHDDCIEETVDIGQRNIIIRPCEDTVLMDKFLQCLLVNALTGILPGKISCTIYDPNNFGRSLTPLFDTDLKEYIEFYNDNLNTIVDELTKRIQSNFKMIGGSTIEEFNMECEKTGITPVDYKLLIILSQPKTLEEDEKLKSLFEYSATGGVFIWVISKSMQSPNAYVFRKPFEGVNNPLSSIINDNWCKDVRIKYAELIEKSRPAGLPWVDFIDNVIPEDKMWTGCADNAMDLFPGYLNGDPSLHKAYTIGNEGNVHVLTVGGTGAGKSVFLNHLIATLTQEYSPKELELWLADFKGTEFKFYLPSPMTEGKMLPHIKACLCTSDGDYATSLFNALRKEADIRYDILKDPNGFLENYKKNPNKYPNKIPFDDGQHIPNFKDAVGWNRYWRNRAKESGDERYLDNIWPRILFLCDEFQVIFEKADSKNADSIKADITQIAKVGRAANVNIFFASQSMNKTLSSDILQQFSLRFALRCDKAVSQDILGTSKASDIKEKFGYLIVKATGIADEDQPRYKTPYFRSNEEQWAHIIKCANKAEELGIAVKDVITYQESTKHDIKELVEFYEDPAIKDKLPDSGMFLLGPRMTYSANKAPDNIILTAKNNTNIMSVFSEYNDLVLFFQQLVENVKRNKCQGTIIVNSQVADLAYITNAESHITFPDKHGRLLSEKNSCSSIIGWVEQLYKTRVEKNKKDTPIYVFLLGWDKGRGFGIDADFGLRTQATNLLNTCGEFNIHIIFINTTMRGIATGIISACDYLIAGKCSQDDSLNLIGTKQAGMNYDVKDGWIFSKHDGLITRDKLYISPIEREIKETTFVM
ncbi:MAG: hypothetical protein IKL53_02265 [Lachnospiraceae bacterium]|nr:hypothetical protein [Lachnospiraceae bacterium]